MDTIDGMTALPRRFAPIALVAMLAMPVVAPAAVSASEANPTSAEAAALTYSNQERASHGLTPLRLDTRVQAIAHGRAQTMAAADELSHDQADGNNVFDILSAQDVAWYGAGEIIAWNTSSSLATSAKGAVSQWIHSPPHKAILLSSNYNYVAFGLAISRTGKRYWAGVYIKGPDRTGAWVAFQAPIKQILTPTKAKVTFRWTGADTKLQVLTAGLRYFEVERRVAGGEWIRYGATTATSLSWGWPRGATYDLRVRALDRAGNWGAWRSVSVKL